MKYNLYELSKPERRRLFEKVGLFCEEVKQVRDNDTGLQELKKEMSDLVTSIRNGNEEKEQKRNELRKLREEVSKPFTDRVSQLEELKIPLLEQLRNIDIQIQEVIDEQGRDEGVKDLTRQIKEVGDNVNIDPFTEPVRQVSRRLYSYEYYTGEPLYEKKRKMKVDFLNEVGISPSLFGKIEERLEKGLS